MNLRPLLALPLVLGIAACSKPPEITASSREEAMDKCMDEAKAALEQAYEERDRAKADPESADWDTNKNIYNEYRWTFLLDDDYETIQITKVYCRPRPNKKHKGYWYNLGYLEYIKHPTEKSIEETEVDKVIVSYGYTWKGIEFP